jgi:hypothetical protein
MTGSRAEFIHDMVQDVLDPIAAHHHCLFVTYLELLDEGKTPAESVADLSRRSGEDEVYLCRVLLDEVGRRRSLLGI